MKTNMSNNRPSVSIVVFVVIVALGMIAGGRIFNQSGNDDLHTSPQTAKPQNTPVATAGPTATNAAYVPLSGPAYATMKIDISCECQDYHHVGNEWGYYFTIDDVRVQSGSEITLETGRQIVICSEITEYDDAKDDVASRCDTLMITEDTIRQGFSVSQTLQVKENGGRYKGNVAEWTVVFTFSP